MNSSRLHVSRNRYPWEVTCLGRKLSLPVNGQRAWKLDGFPAARKPLGIEAEGHRIEFRNLRIKTTPK